MANVNSTNSLSNISIFLADNGNISDTTVPQADDYATTFGIVIGIFAIIVGTLGNLCTIIVVSRNKAMMASCFNLLVLSLATVDFITAAFMLPANVAFYILKQQPFLGFYCRFQAFFYYSCGYISVVHFMVIAVTRYIGIVLPNKWNFLVNDKRYIYLWIFISWTFAPAVLSPFWFEAHGGFGWYPSLTLCVFKVWTYSDPWKNYMITTRIMFQLLPAILMSYIYFVIYRTTNQSEKTISSFKENTSASEVLDDANTNSPGRKVGIHKPLMLSESMEESNSIKRHTLNVLDSVRRTLSVGSLVSNRESDSKNDDFNTLTSVTPIHEGTPRKGRKASNTERSKKVGQCEKSCNFQKSIVYFIVSKLCFLLQTVLLTRQSIEANRCLSTLKK